MESFKMCASICVFATEKFLEAVLLNMGQFDPYSTKPPTLVLYWQTYSLLKEGLVENCDEAAAIGQISDDEQTNSSCFCMGAVVQN